MKTIDWLGMGLLEDLTITGGLKMLLPGVLWEERVGLERPGGTK